ncbi:MAG TPA: hypothetical protein VGL66_14925 [Caulobacteraceae bacterium]|jgi:hypothetical protein
MKRQLYLNLAMGAVIVAVALGMKWAQHQGLIEAQSATRWTMAIIGLQMAINANLIPKAGTAKTARHIALQRVCGWAMMLGGLGYAAAWAFVPLSNAATLSMVAVAAAILWVIGFGVISSRRTGTPA